MTPFHGMDYAQALFDSGNPKEAVDILARMLEYVDPELSKHGPTPDATVGSDP